MAPSHWHTQPSNLNPVSKVPEQMRRAFFPWKKANITFAYTARWTGTMALPEVYDLDVNGIPLSVFRSTTSKPFSLHNIQVTKIFSETFSLYAGVQNLFNYRQFISPLIGYNDPNAATGFSPFFDTSYAYAPNHGREAYLGAKWNLR